jgi:hypothetical protein
MRKRTLTTPQSVKPAGGAYPHQQNYTNRMLTSGLVRLTVWVPESKREELKSIAKKMREKCRK